MALAAKNQTDPTYLARQDINLASLAAGNAGGLRRDSDPAGGARILCIGHGCDRSHQLHRGLPSPGGRRSYLVGERDDGT